MIATDVMTTLYLQILRGSREMFPCLKRLCGRFCTYYTPSSTRARKLIATFQDLLRVAAFRSLLLMLVSAIMLLMEHALASSPIASLFRCRGDHQLEIATY